MRGASKACILERGDRARDGRKGWSRILQLLRDRAREDDGLLRQRRWVTLVVKTRDAQFDLDAFLHVLEVLAELVWELVTAKSRGRRGQGDIPAAAKIHGEHVPERDPVVVVVLVGELEDTALELGMTSADCQGVIDQTRKEQQSRGQMDARFLCTRSRRSGTRTLRGTLTVCWAFS